MEEKMNTDKCLKEQIRKVLNQKDVILGHWHITKDYYGNCTLQLDFYYDDIEFYPYFFKLTKEQNDELELVFEQLDECLQNELFRNSNSNSNFHRHLLENYINDLPLVNAPIQEFDTAALSAHKINTGNGDAMKIKFEHINWILFSMGNYVDNADRRNITKLTEINNKIVNQLFDLGAYININEFTCKKFSDFTIDLNLSTDEILYLYEYTKDKDFSDLNKTLLRPFVRSLRIDAVLKD